jgi:hypothetical protein
MSSLTLLLQDPCFRFIAFQSFLLELALIIDLCQHEHTSISIPGTNMLNVHEYMSPLGLMAGARLDDQCDLTMPSS